MTTLETLKAARAKIADRKNWTRGVFARDQFGRPCSEASPLACCWCSVGAIYAISRAAGTPFALGWDVLCAALPRGRQNIAVFNDSHTHAEVLALFDKAIASLEAA